MTPIPEKNPDTYLRLVERLSRASVKKHFDAYEDVPWDHPDCRIDPEDPRWERGPDDLLGGTEWYQSRPASERARMGLHLTVCQMKMGIEFENILARGLLEFAATRPNRSPDYRYAYHEIIEEGQHSLMFQEFVNRSGFDAPGMTPFIRWASRSVPPLGRAFPELFFVHVLAGELPIDHLQRKELRRGDALHPLLRRVVQIHITEEARHVSFARAYLATHVRALSFGRRLRLRLIAPFVLRETTALMLRPPEGFFREHRVPRSVISEAYGGDRYHALACDGLRQLRETCSELGVVTPATVPLWKALRIWPAQEPGNALLSRPPRLLSR